MNNRNRHLILLILAGLFILAGCADDPAVNGSSGDSPSAADPGTAVFSYTYLVNDPPNLVILIQPDIMATFKRVSEDSGKYTLDGFINTTAFMTLMGTNEGEDCHVQCDLPLLYTVSGNLLKTLKDGKVECDLEVTFEAAFGQGEIQRYGDCPATVTNNYPCELVIKSFLNPEGALFSKDQHFIKLSDESGVTHTAEIKSVDFPDNVCEWDIKAK